MPRACSGGVVASAWTATATMRSAARTAVRASVARIGVVMPGAVLKDPVAHGSVY